MKEWLRAVLVNAPAVLLLAIVFSSVYLTATGKDIPAFSTSSPAAYWLRCPGNDSRFQSR